MANEYLLERDVVSGKTGKAFITIDGKVQELFRAKKVQADAEIQTTEIKVIGTTRVQDKNIGVKQTGSMTIYYGSDLFTDMALQYIENGKVIYFDLQVTNNDPASTVGTQTLVYYGCKITGTIPLSMLDADSDALEQEVTFSYSRVAKLKAFNAEANYGTANN